MVWNPSRKIVQESILSLNCEVVQGFRCCTSFTHCYAIDKINQPGEAHRRITAAMKDFLVIISHYNSLKVPRMWVSDTNDFCPGVGLLTSSALAMEHQHSSSAWLFFKASISLNDVFYVWLNVLITVTSPWPYMSVSSFFFFFFYVRLSQFSGWTMQRLASSWAAGTKLTELLLWVTSTGICWSSKLVSTIIPITLYVMFETSTEIGNIKMMLRSIESKLWEKLQSNKKNADSLSK